ncbi:putative ABC transport system permease protein [Flexibacter flexilis DSM 6793]|uniref:Putative ABC transport system permease protein n=1 Tax=Flexibacter flexilis DSM 6793 TaxID=927664 RepID=A0A1I1DQX3_9BACT|nr:ABC transporter permease [Flexibacter flexilis]SFB77301.1 putative ABC transport system permease protein [Flexibacter flexilis DSM 6793]
MFDLDKWQEIYHTVRKNKLRTALTAFGVFWGIFMLILLLGAGKGLENGVKQGFGAYSVNSMYVWTERTSIPHNGIKPGRDIQLTNDDIAAVSREIEGVEAIAPRMNLWGEFTVNYKNKNGAFNVKGDWPEIMLMQPMELAKGRFLNKSDEKEGRKVAVLGERVVEVLFGETDPIGKYISIKGVYFKVIGVFKSKKKGNNGREDAQTIFMPLSTMQNTYNMINKVGYFVVLVKNGVLAKDIKEQIKKLLAQRQNFSEKDDQALGAWDAQEEFNNFQGLFNGINTFIWVVSFFTIVAGVVGVSNIMLIVVKERTKEIGIRKALGATPWSIVSLIVQESIVITTVAGYSGLILGVALVEGLNYGMQQMKVENDFFHNPEIDFTTAMTATALMVFAGALAGFVPATKAASVSPIEALRYE